jgi:hypothetical protein
VIRTRLGCPNNFAQSFTVQQQAEAISEFILKQTIEYMYSIYVDDLYPGTSEYQDFPTK